MLCNFIKTVRNQRNTFLSATFRRAARELARLADDLIFAQSP